MSSAIGVHRCSVDGGDDVAGVQAGLCGRAALRHRGQQRAGRVREPRPWSRSQAPVASLLLRRPAIRGRLHPTTRVGGRRRPPGRRAGRPTSSDAPTRVVSSSIPTTCPWLSTKGQPMSASSSGVRTEVAAKVAGRRVGGHASSRSRPRCRHRRRGDRLRLWSPPVAWPGPGRASRPTGSSSSKVAAGRSSPIRRTARSDRSVGADENGWLAVAVRLDDGDLLRPVERPGRGHDDAARLDHEARHAGRPVAAGGVDGHGRLPHGGDDGVDAFRRGHVPGAGLGGGRAVGQTRRSAGPRRAPRRCRRRSRRRRRRSAPHRANRR